jgi:hypothetical protein
VRKCLVLVDNSNVFIGGQKYSAECEKRRGEAPVDRSWRLDFEGLLTCLAADRSVHAAIMVGSGPDGHAKPWEVARDSGFEVIVHERERGEGEKCIDTELVARGTEIIATAEEPMVLVIASGDRDFLPLVEVAHRHGWEVELCAFRNSFPDDGDLAQAVDRVRPLDECFERIGYREGEAVKQAA